MENLKNYILNLTPEERKKVLNKLTSIQSSKDSLNKGKNDINFSLFFFSDKGGTTDKKYDLLIECAKYADKNGFHAIWVPERHFHEFGALYPSPSVLLSALSMITKNLRLQSGSIVLPLHHPVRVAEEWSMIDNLSQGRVGLSVASGWNKDDFILSNTSYKKKKEFTFESIGLIKRLWEGEKIEFEDRDFCKAQVKIYPKPIQKTLPVWVTSAANPDTWLSAAKIGANILTGLMEQTVDELAKKIALYRQALQKNNFDASVGKVTVMLHTYVNDNIEVAKKLVKPVLTNYFKNHLSLYEKQVNNAQNTNIDLSLITEQDKNALIQRGFERYFNTSSLLGDINSCTNMINKLKHIGVNEIACLINFGLHDDLIIKGLSNLNLLKNRFIKSN